jgi:hypothetical protein
MAELRQQDSGINWAVVGVGAIFMALTMAAIQEQIFGRIVVALAILGITVWWSRPRHEPLVENPLFDQLHSQQHGLDRRKYGKLRSTTDDLLDYIRQMNRVAVEGREGKLSPRHTQAELDRLAAKLRDVVDEIRKTAGVPTPLAEPGPRDTHRGHPKVVIPKAQATPDMQPASSPTSPPPEPEPPREFYDEANVMLDDLVAKAEAEARGDDESQPKPNAPTDENGPEGEQKPRP